MLRAMIRALPSVLSLVALSTLVASGCGDKEVDDTAAAATDDTGGGSTDCDGVYDLTWDNWGSSFFATYCDSCHAASSPNRFGAPEYATFDTEEEVRNWQEPIRFTVLEEETMPLGGGVYEDDLFLLEIYLDCGLD